MIIFNFSERWVFMRITLLIPRNTISIKKRLKHKILRVCNQFKHSNCTNILNSALVYQPMEKCMSENLKHRKNTVYGN